MNYTVATIQVEVRIEWYSIGLVGLCNSVAYIQVFYTEKCELSSSQKNNNNWYSSYREWSCLGVNRVKEYTDTVLQQLFIVLDDIYYY